ncbi:MAG: hypothetical protein L6R48_23170 [Planctomycetes bacterium]|nr:hypothetical protein [Planctomycetota bacterium]
MSSRRDRLGGMWNLHERQHVYLTADALEIDQTDGYDVTRRRVFLNDVVLVTVHQERRWGLALTMWMVAGLVAAPGAVAVLIASQHGDFERVLWVVLEFLGIPAAVLVLLGLVPLLVLTPVLSVFGRRTKAAMRFTWRRRRALVVRDRLVAAVTAAQAAPPT